MPPPKPNIRGPEIPEEGELGSDLEHGYFSTENELIDFAEPTADELAFFVMHDGQAQAINLAYSLPILGAEFAIEEGPDDKGEAEAIRNNLLRSQFMGGMTTPMGQVIAQMTSAFPNKRAFFEKDIKYFDDGFVGYKKLAYRPVWQCTVRGDDTGGFVQRGYRGNGMGFTEVFGPEKSFVYIHRNHMRPLEGVSIFQTAYMNYIDKLRVKRLHNIHLQNFSLGTVVGKYEGTEGRPALMRFFKKLQKFRGGGGQLVLGAGENLEFKNAAGAGAEFLRAIEHLDAEMARSCLTQFLVLGQGGNSSVWNLSRDQSAFFIMCLEAELRDIEEAITNHLIAPSCAGTSATTPRSRSGSSSRSRMPTSRRPSRSGARSWWPPSARRVPYGRPSRRRPSRASGSTPASSSPRAQRAPRLRMVARPTGRRPTRPSSSSSTSSREERPATGTEGLRLRCRLRPMGRPLRRPVPHRAPPPTPTATPTGLVGAGS